MFTGIIECMGKILERKEERGNLILTIESFFLSELEINQSISHNGACLSVSDIGNKGYSVTLIKETLQKKAEKSLKNSSASSNRKAKIITR